MYLLNKYDDINSSFLVVGAFILQMLKGGNYRTESLFQKCKVENNIALNQFLNTITFLWILDLILFEDGVLKIKK